MPIGDTFEAIRIDLAGVQLNSDARTISRTETIVSQAFESNNSKLEIALLCRRRLLVLAFSGSIEPASKFHPTSLSRFTPAN